MANVFAPFGFRSFGTLEGNSPTYGLTRRYLATSDTNLYFTGDVVQVSTGALSPAGFIAISNSSNNPIIEGVFAGCEFFSPSVGRTIWSSFFPGTVGSSNTGNAYVIEGEDNLFLVQCTTNAVVGTSCIGMNACYTSTGTLGAQSAGNQVTGISNVALQSTSVSALSSLPFRIVDTTSNYFPPGTNGSDGTTAGAIVVVSFNNQLRRSLTGVST
jgi:hypothetical protein